MRIKTELWNDDKRVKRVLFKATVFYAFILGLSGMILIGYKSYVMGIIDLMLWILGIIIMISNNKWEKEQWTSKPESKELKLEE